VCLGIRFPYQHDHLIHFLLPTQATNMWVADKKRCASRTCDFDFGDDLIILDDEPSRSTGPHASNSTGPQSSGLQPEANQHCLPGINVLTKLQPAPIKKTTRPTAGLENPWTCLTCMLINQPLAMQCNTCLALQPPLTQTQMTDPVPTVGWTCSICGEQGMEHTFWTCRFCGSVKTESTFG